MTPAEKKDTPSANGQPVELNSASKKDLAALPGVGPQLLPEHHRRPAVQLKRKIC
jgi:DNA uptake protein ComE-like DNA-binding protein